MAFPKLVFNNSFAFGDIPLVSLADDSSKFRKSAAKLGSSPVVEQWGRVDPIPGHTLVHLLALSDFEKSGNNANGDAFREAHVKEVHPSFVSHGALYKDHKSKGPKYGQIIKSAHNDVMGRTELLVAHDNDKCAEWLGKIERGDPAAYSMGYSCETDQCNICHKKASNRSEYCFVPGTEITMEDGTVLPIESIKVGDRVLAADGTSTVVTQLFVREIDENVVQIHSSLFGGTTRVTANHPFLVMPGEFGRIWNLDNEMYATKVNPEPLMDYPGFEKFLVPPQFIPSGMIRKKDFVFAPVLQRDPSKWDGFCDEEAAWVYGLFIAEGSYGKERKDSEDRISIQFSLCEDETEEVDRVRNFFATRYGKDLKIYGRPNSRGISARIHSREIARHFYEICGEYAQNKRIHPKLLHAPDSILRALVDGIWDGDGHTYEERGAGGNRYSRINSASRDLVVQLWHIVSRWGHTAYRSYFVQVGGPTKRTNKSDSWYLTTNFRGDEKALQRGRSRFNGVPAGYVDTLDHVPYVGPVYNFETEVHTYVANGFAVHNCDHVKRGARAPYGMNRILPDGRKCFVFNIKGHFNDISMVPVGADPIAFSLRKVAGLGDDETMGGADLAEAYLGTQDDGAPDVAKLALARKLSMIEKRLDAAGIHSYQRRQRDVTPISKEARDTLRSAPAPEMFAELAKVGAVLPPHDFFALIFGDEFPAHRAVIDKVAARCSRAFGALEEDFERLSKVCGNFAYDAAPSRIVTGMVLKRAGLDEYTRAFGLDPALSSQRASRAAAVAKVAADEPLRPTIPDPRTDYLVDQYAAYKLASLVAIGADDARLFAATLEA